MIQWTCPNCLEESPVGYDWKTCQQVCEVCGSECEVTCTVHSVRLITKRDLDQEKSDER